MKTCEDCERDLHPDDGNRCRYCDPYKLEYCTNPEWLVVFGPYEEDPEADASEPSPQACELLQEEIMAVDTLAGAKLQSPGKGRSICHGWNGAHFAWRYRQFGSFETLPDMLRQAIETAIDRCAPCPSVS